MYSFIFNLLLVCAFIYLDLYRTLKSSQRREARFMALHCLSISSTASREVDNLSGLTTILYSSSSRLFPPSEPLALPPVSKPRSGRAPWRWRWPPTGTNAIKDQFWCVRACVLAFAYSYCIAIQTAWILGCVARAHSFRREFSRGTGEVQGRTRQNCQVNQA